MRKDTLGLYAMHTKRHSHALTVSHTPASGEVKMGLPSGLSSRSPSASKSAGGVLLTPKVAKGELADVSPMSVAIGAPGDIPAMGVLVDAAGPPLPGMVSRPVAGRLLPWSATDSRARVASRRSASGTAPRWRIRRGGNACTSLTLVGHLKGSVKVIVRTASATATWNGRAHSET